MAASINDGHGSYLLFISLRYFPGLTRPSTVNKNFDNSRGSGLQDVLSRSRKNNPENVLFGLFMLTIKALEKSFYEGQHFRLEDSHLDNLIRNELKIQESSLDFLNWFVGTCFPYL